MVKYETGTAKGDIASGVELNSPFKLGEAIPNYTSDRVVESLSAGTGNVLAWAPVVKGAFDDAGVAKDARVTAAGGSVSYLYVNPADNKLYSSFNGSAYSSEYSASAGDKVAYIYDNVLIPKDKIPSIVAKMDSIPLLAKARRIAVYYSQIAAFQAKTDYGLTLYAA